MLQKKIGLFAPRQAAAHPPPSLTDKLRRGLWGVVSVCIYRLVPTPLHGIRCTILRAFGAQIEKGALPYPAAKIWAPWNLEMRRNSCIANGAICYNVARIILEESSIVSQGAYLCTASHDHRSSDFTLVAAEIVVGKGSWVAAEAFVGPGVTIGEGAVLGARAVVMRSVPSHAVLVGNPASVVGIRSTPRR